MRQPNKHLIAAEALAAWNNKSAPAAAVDTLTLRCELITPMYGGGVIAGEVDTALPIRASALRGQLRFWWRIACAPFASPTQMFRREAAIWGGIASTQPTASKVAVRVDRITGLRVSQRLFINRITISMANLKPCRMRRTGWKPTQCFRHAVN